MGGHPGITREVMVILARSPSLETMKNLRRVLPLVVLLPFTAYSLWVVATRGYLGFITLAGREPWALQLLLDLTICCVLIVTWMVPDARARGIAVWPYLIATLFVGSIGPLAYLTHRAWRPRPASVVAPRRRLDW
jgi:Terpene cyclase DEP1